MLTDILVLPGKQVRHPAVPAENLYDRIRYEQELRRAGFDRISVTSIREQVMEPFLAWLRGLRPPRGLRQRLAAALRGRVTARMDYVLAVASKKACDERAASAVGETYDA